MKTVCFTQVNNTILLPCNKQTKIHTSPLTQWRPLDNGSCAIDPQNDQRWLPFGSVVCPHIRITVLHKHKLGLQDCSSCTPMTTPTMQDHTHYTHHAILHLAVRPCHTFSIQDGVHHTHHLQPHPLCKVKHITYSCTCHQHVAFSCPVHTSHSLSMLQNYLL